MCVTPTTGANCREWRYFYKATNRQLMETLKDPKVCGTLPVSMAMPASRERHRATMMQQLEPLALAS